MNEFYFELTVTPPKELQEIFSSFLLEVTQNAIEEDNGSLIVRSSEPLDDIEWAVQQLSLKLSIDVPTAIEQKKNEDWIALYQNAIQPIEVGSFYVRPEWEASKADKENIIINPALAFGSGHHETTHSCLMAIDKYVEAEKSLLDVGTGSGILAIAAAKKGSVVDLCDTDEISTQSAQENFVLNQAAYRNIWTGSANKTTQMYDVVIANIIADVIIMIHKDLKSRVKSGGILILSGIIDKYFEKVQEKFKEFNTLEIIQKDEWYTLVLKRI